MRTMQAFMRGEEARASNQPTRVFDWKKAVEIIQSKGIKNASAGLEHDWEWTGGKILFNGEIVNGDETYTYLASCWATPLLRDDDSDEEYECWVYAGDSTYQADTYWPEDAVDLLNNKEEK